MDWKIFRSGFAGAFLGKIAGAVFLAICAALYFGPERWVAWIMSQLPISPAIGQTVFSILAAVTFVFLIVPQLVTFFRWLWSRRRGGKVETAVVETQIARTELETRPAVTTAPKVVEKEEPAKPIEQKDAASPIEWKFSDVPTIFGWNEANDGTFLVGTFNICGRNISGDEIRNVMAHVTPQVTSSPIELRFYNPRHAELLNTKEYLIQPDADFQLSYKLPSYDNDKSLQGVPVEHFLAQYGALRFVFEYNDGGRIVRDFSYEALEKYLFNELKNRSRSRVPQPDLKRVE